MLKHQLEGWALDVLDRVTSGGRLEDARVEIKREWPDPVEAARRIAGHANAARGAPILWLIGVDEKARTVPGADYEELANWFPRVQSQFDELAPSLQDLNVPYKGATVVALHFESDRAPFVVKNPGGGPIDREVPWREGTKTRSASRANLVRLLSGLHSLPDVELLAATLTASRTKEAGADGAPVNRVRWNLYVALYVSPQTDERVAIPFHRCTASVKFHGGANMRLTDFRLARQEAVTLPFSSVTSPISYVGSSPVYLETEAVIEHPSRYIVSAQTLSEDADKPPPAGDVVTSVVLRPTKAEIGVSVVARLKQGKDERFWAVWVADIG